ncbi:hypothetical protein D3C80_974120 [compost metagenome]
MVLIDDRDRQLDRRLTDIGHRVVEGVGDHGQEDGAGQGAVFEDAGEGPDKGSAEAAGGQVQGEVFGLGRASGAAMGEGDGEGEGPDRNAQQDQQRP